MGVRNALEIRNFAIAAATAAGLSMGIAPAIAQTDTAPPAGVLAIPGSSGARAKVDFVTAKVKPLPMNRSFSREAFKKEVVTALDGDGSLDDTVLISRASTGDGKRAPGKPNVGKALAVGNARFEREDSGRANLPFSTARADLAPAPTNTEWPYRAAGKLFFKEGSASYVCSASLIDRGLVVTAAHCVADYGKNKIYSDWKFIPGYRNGAAPFGVWTAAKAYVLAGYPAGTAPCDDGVVCRDDIAILVLATQKNATDNKPFFAGDRTGWFSYAQGRAPFTKNGLTHITQIGYPVCLDNGNLMQRNDAQGAISASNRDNTVFGSLMCGGSSGGPWLANFGVRPDLTDTIEGSFGKPNVVIGVTSWGASDKTVKQQGASPFLVGNIDFLVKAACKDFPDACSQ